MTTSAPARRPQRSRVVAGLVAGMLVVLGCLLVVLPWTADDAEVHDDRWLLLGLGLALLAAAAGLALLRVAGPGHRAAVLADPDAADGPVLRVGLRPAVPLATAVVGGSFALLCGAAGVALGVPGPGLLLLPVAVACALPVPDAVRALLRRPEVRLDVRRMEVRGWTLDRSLAWGDVDAVLLDDTDPRHPRLVVRARPGAESLRSGSHRLLVPLETGAGPSEIALAAAALDHPHRLVVLVRALAEAPAGERAGLLDERGAAFLDGAR